MRRTAVTMAAYSRFASSGPIGTLGLYRGAQVQMPSAPAVCLRAAARGWLNPGQAPQMSRICDTSDRPPCQCRSVFACTL